MIKFFVIFIINFFSLFSHFIIYFIQRPSVATIQQILELLKSKSSIETIFLSKGLTGKKHIISYSRIGFRASTPLFASIAILGYPARLYDGSWIEFSSFASDFSGTNLITNSPWRTDRTSLVDSLTYASPSNVIPTFSYPTTSQFSTNSNKIIDEDKNYIRGTIPSTNTGGGASGGGGNACGG